MMYFYKFYLQHISHCVLIGRAQSPSSGEDEPPNKKSKPEGLLGSGPPGMPGSMMSQGLMPPHSVGQFGPPMGPMMGPMGMAPPFMGPGYVKTAVYCLLSNFLHTL